MLGQGHTYSWRLSVPSLEYQGEAEARSPANHSTQRQRALSSPQPKSGLWLTTSISSRSVLRENGNWPASTSEYGCFSNLDTLATSLLSLRRWRLSCCFWKARVKTEARWLGGPECHGRAGWEEGDGGRFPGNSSGTLRAAVSWLQSRARSLFLVWSWRKEGNRGAGGRQASE